MGEHALSFWSYAALHVFRHERLRTLRAAAVLVDHVLAVNSRVSWCPLHRACSSRRGRFVPCAVTPAAPERARACPGGGSLLSDGRGERLVVLLQHSCSE